MSKYHTFCTHNWGKNRRNHEEVVAIAGELQRIGVATWIDEEEMSGRVTATMCRGIDDSATFTVFITEEYITKVAGTGRNKERDNCLKEFEYAESRKGSGVMIAVVMEPTMSDTSKWLGPVGANLSGKMHIRGWGRTAREVAQEVASEVERLIPGFRARQQDATQADADARHSVDAALAAHIASVSLTGKVEAHLHTFGVELLKDLHSCTEQELVGLGMKPMHARRLLKGADGDAEEEEAKLQKRSRHAEAEARCQQEAAAAEEWQRQERQCQEEAARRHRRDEEAAARLCAVQQEWRRQQVAVETQQQPQAANQDSRQNAGKVAASSRQQPPDAVLRVVGAGRDTVNGYYKVAGSLNGKRHYLKIGDGGEVAAPKTEIYWIKGVMFFGKSQWKFVSVFTGEMYSCLGNSAAPPRSGWNVVGRGAPAPTVTPC